MAKCVSGLTPKELAESKALEKYWSSLQLNYLCFSELGVEVLAYAFLYSASANQSGFDLGRSMASHN